MTRAFLLGLFFLPWAAFCFFVSNSGPTYGTPLINTLLVAFNTPSRRAETEMTKTYLKSGVNPNSLGLHGTPLHIAAFRNNSELVKALIEHGALINRQECHEGITPLMMAAKLGNKEALVILLKYGADTSIRSKDGKNAIDLSINNDIREILLKKQENK